MFSAKIAKTLLITSIGAVMTNCRAYPQDLKQTAPGHQRILFDSDRDGNPGIYVMYPDGSNPQRLTDDNGSAEGPAWSPDRKKVAFTTRDGIGVMDADGSNPQLLTRTDGEESGEPAWSPDGKRIAFTSPDEIYVMNANGSNAQRLTHTGGYGSENPDWSPDGKKIAFAFRPLDANREIYVMDPDGSNLRRLTQTPVESSHPVWSPEGKRIAFQSTRDGNMEIYTMDADGANVRKLSNTPVGRSLNPDWSPDGKKIAFGSERDGNMEIYVGRAGHADRPAQRPDVRPLSPSRPTCSRWRRSSASTARRIAPTSGTVCSPARREPAPLLPRLRRTTRVSQGDRAGSIPARHGANWNRATDLRWRTDAADGGKHVPEHRQAVSNAHGSARVDADALAASRRSTRGVEFHRRRQAPRSRELS